MTDRRARDIELLDALDTHAGIPFEGDVWRIVSEARDVLQGSATKGRWDPGTFDVIYTCLERDGALEEIYFHFSRQPVFPSKIQSVLHRINVKTQRTLRLADLSAVANLGVNIEQYGELSYERTQEIGDAAFFLGFDGILAPSARCECHNLVLFVDRFAPSDLILTSSEPVDWNHWRKSHQSKDTRLSR